MARVEKDKARVLTELGWAIPLIVRGRDELPRCPERTAITRALGSLRRKEKRAEKSDSGSNTSWAI